MFILKPSDIQGVGVFTTHSLKKGAYADLFYKDDCTYINSVLIQQEEKEWYELFGIPTNGGYFAPTNPVMMSIGWYLNHSNTPNLIPDNNCDYYYAARDIDEGEELTIDYNLLFD